MSDKKTELNNFEELFDESILNQLKKEPSIEEKIEQAKEPVISDSEESLSLEDYPSETDEDVTIIEETESEEDLKKQEDLMIELEKQISFGVKEELKKTDLANKGEIEDVKSPFDELLKQSEEHTTDIPETVKVETPVIDNVKKEFNKDKIFSTLKKGWIIFTSVTILYWSFFLWGMLNSSTDIKIIPKEIVKESTLNNKYLYLMDNTPIWIEKWGVKGWIKDFKEWKTLLDANSGSIKNDLKVTIYSIVWKDISISTTIWDIKSGLILVKSERIETPNNTWATIAPITATGTIKK